MSETKAANPHGFDRKMLERLVCPRSQAQELVSEVASLAYPIRNGIPVMLVDEAREIDV